MLKKSNYFKLYGLFFFFGLFFFVNNSFASHSNNIPFGMYFNDSFGNGYCLAPYDLDTTSYPSYNSDGYCSNADYYIMQDTTIEGIILKPIVNTINRSWDVTLYINGSASSYVITVPSSDTTIIEDTTYSIPVSQGDTVSLGVNMFNANGGNWRVQGEIILPEPESTGGGGDTSTTTTILFEPCEIPENDTIQQITGCMNIYNTSSTSPSEVRYYQYDIKFILYLAMFSFAVIIFVIIYLYMFRRKK